MSTPRSEMPGSSVRQRPTTHNLDTGDDILSAHAPSTDDTPTIISRNSPAPAGGIVEEPVAAIRGRRLAHFELIEPIGVGGMAAVIRARDTQLDRFVALKILPPEMAADAENVRRFHQEARSAAKLDHENIARVFFCGEDQRLHFIAFEFVEGENLRTLLEQRGSLPVGEAVHYMLQVAAGLAHANRRGVVHRDIKPSNIIITPNGRAKLVDMGLARSLEPRTDNDLTQSGVTLGTFDYISPEQALEPRDADVRSDIYSLGCTFYHALTGRPPVPEGTAAKKLHHHQHVKPVDPRQYVPDLPPDVAQILDRMMAKNPRDRFQSPEHLVHQLLLVARRLGTAPDVPEGVLSVEASVPNPPTSRPFLWAALAAVAVIALVLLLDQSPSGTSREKLPHRNGKPETPQENANVKDAGPAVKPPPGPAEGKVGEPYVEVARYVAEPNSSAADLVAWLKKNADATRLELLLPPTLEVKDAGLGPSGLVIQARDEVIIRPLKDSALVRFDYDGSPGDRFVALTIQSKKSTVERIRFVADAHETDKEVIALRLQAGTHQVKRCEFFQFGTDKFESSRLSSVLADAGSSRCDLTLTDCVFLGRRESTGNDDLPDASGRPALAGLPGGGQDAVVRRGPATILAENCVFGPHTAAFRFREGTADEASPVTVRNCTVLLAARRSSAFDVDPKANARVHAQSSLFARWPGEGTDGAVLLRQADESSRVVYHGQDNAYHDLDGYWESDGSWKKAGWQDFQQKLYESSKDQSRVLTVSPWQTANPELQVAALERLQYGKALGLNFRLGALRKAATEVVGTRAILGERVPATLPSLPEKEELLARRIVVEEDNDDSSNGFYPTLHAAVSSARKKDTILIRHTGELKVNRVELNTPNLQALTIKAARGFRPVLTLSEEAADREAPLFGVYDGSLELEGLEFRIQPGSKPIKAVLALMGDCDCVMRECAVTLVRAGERPLSLAALGKIPSDRMEMRTARLPQQGPRLLLKKCFVRGDGDLLSCQANRPFSLEVKDSLIAQAGAVFHLDLTLPEGKPESNGRVMKLEFERTVTYLGAPLIHRNVVGKDVGPLLPIQCRANGCLFLPATTGKPLIHLEGAGSDDETLRDKFTWVDRQVNAYGPYTAFMVHEKRMEMMAPVGPATWKTMMGEESSTFNVKMKEVPELSSTLRYPQITPEKFKTPAEPGLSDLIPKVPTPGS